MVDQTVARVLDLVEIETEIVRRWCGVAGNPAAR
jgi:3-polyprenyl-4-hydroxybenzoate decarboxylase